MRSKPLSHAQFIKRLRRIGRRRRTAVTAHPAMKRTHAGANMSTNKSTNSSKLASFSSGPLLVAILVVENRSNVKAAARLATLATSGSRRSACIGETITVSGFHDLPISTNAIPIGIPTAIPPRRPAFSPTSLAGSRFGNKCSRPSICRPAAAYIATPRRPRTRPAPMPTPARAARPAKLTRGEMVGIGHRRAAHPDARAKEPRAAITRANLLS